MSLRFRRPRAALAATAALTLCLVAGTVVAARAAPAASRNPAAKEQPAPVPTQVASTDAPAAAESAPVCAKMRRKLWIEGEGWFVRRVSAC